MGEVVEEAVVAEVDAAAVEADECVKSVDLVCVSGRILDNA